MTLLFGFVAYLNLNFALHTRAILRKNFVNKTSLRVKVSSMILWVVYIMLVGYAFVTFGVTYGLGVSDTDQKNPNMKYGKTLGYPVSAATNPNSTKTTTEIIEGGSYLCWFSGLGWWIGYFTPYISSVVLCVISLFITSYYIVSDTVLKKSDFKNLFSNKGARLRDMGNSCIYSSLIVICFFFMMWSELDFAMLPVFTWIFIGLKFVAGVVFVLLFFRDDYFVMWQERYLAGFVRSLEQKRK